MATARTPRSRWIDEGLRALAGGRPGRGPDRVARQGARRHQGRFLRYFDDRPALLEEMLDAWELTMIDEVIERVEGEGGDARQKLRRLSGLAGSARAG